MKMCIRDSVSAATEYGKECTGEHENAEVFFGRMDQKQMAEMIKEKQIDLVIDADVYKRQGTGMRNAGNDRDGKNV